jgi:ABC-2 type transport system permease protein
MNPLIYDIKRVFLSKSVLILMALMILLSFFLLASFSTTTTSQESFANMQVLTWYDSSGSYHFLAFAWNTYGQPVSSTSFQINMTAAACPSDSTYTASGVTNANGEANLTIYAPVDADYSVCVSWSQQASSVSSEYTTPYENFAGGNNTAIPPGQVVGINGEGLSTVLVNGNFIQQEVLANWAGAYGSSPTNYPIYYQFLNNTDQCSLNSGVACVSNFNPTAYSEANMQRLYDMSGYFETLRLPPLPAGIEVNSSNIIIGLFYPNGTAVNIVEYSTSGLYQQNSLVTVSQGNQTVLAFFAGIFGLFIPLVAILGAYNSYGKDRTSGVLESVLAQPISRRDLSISRFVSTFVAMAIATSIAMGVVDGIYHYYTGAFFDPTLLLISAAAFFVELASFTAIMMLFSRIIRSSGLLVGLGIGLFLLFGLFWSLIIDLVELALNPHNVNFTQITIIGEFTDPSSFVALVDTYVTHSLSGGGIFGIVGFSLPISPSNYGITVFSLVATAVLWIAIPLAAFLYLSIKKD